ncbi:DUF6479 family protein [Streptacidiphilus sp. N1-12]|uniref:DUF6479 family protein n=2 Tax=Streptacidiphilus alkalitolerans TaxID=3342712 RepID=A0ABV6XD89_9ACTN
MEAAGSGGSAGIIALVIGVVVVVGLIAAFVLGSRRKEREPAPVAPDLGPPPGHAAARPTGQPTDPGQGSWSTPPSTPGRAPQGDRSPHQD